MWIDFFIPCSLIALKQILKLVVDEEVKILEMGKSILALPVDITFLSLSYGSAQFVKQASSGFIHDKAIYLAAGLFATFTVILVVIFATKRSTRSMLTSSFAGMIIWSLVSYLVSILTLVASVSTVGAL